MGPHGGFSLVETLLAMSIALVVTAGVFSALNPAQGSFSTQLEAADVQQRLRVAADTVYKDLVMAGAGADSGTAAGSLVYHAAPILPSRRGAANADPPATYRGDTITLRYVPTSSSQTVSSHTYYVKPSTWQLMHYDGTINPDVPVVDHVVGLHFEYYGDPQPPQLTGTSLDDPAGPWTTYGPPPSSISSGVPSPGYAAGENCVFMVSDGLQVPRLAELSPAPTLVKLTPMQLVDGPWCPDAASADRFDADLYRIRKVIVTIRIEAASQAMRGPASVLFANGGTSTSGSRWLPDEEVTFHVAPRNVNFGR